MAIEFVRDSTTGIAANTVVATSFTVTPTVGNYVIVSCASWTSMPAGIVQSVEDNQGNSYSRAIATAAVGWNTSAEIWYAKVATASGTFTVTVTWDKYTGGANACGASEFSGIAASSPLDGTPVAVDRASGANPTVGPITPSGNAVYVAVLSLGGTAGITKGAAWTTRHVLSDTSNVNAHAESLISSGEKSADWTAADNDHSACIAAFKEDAGGGPRKWLFGART